MKLGLIAWLTFHEARRRRLLWVGAVLGIAFLLLFAVGYRAVYGEAYADSAGREFMLRQVTGTLTMAGLYAVNFLVVVISVLLAVDSISGEITSHSVQSLVTKPIRRWEVVAGKWLGLAVLVSGATLALAGGVILISYFIGGFLPKNVVEGLSMMLLEGLVLLALVLLGGTRFSTLANGVFAFGLYSLAFIGGWVEQIGSVIRNETAVNVGIVSSLILPTEALWKRTAHLMSETGAAFISPFSAGSLPSPAMVLYAVLYGAGALAAAIYFFSKRDL